MAMMGDQSRQAGIHALFSEGDQSVAAQPEQEAGKRQGGDFGGERVRALFTGYGRLGDRWGIDTRVRGPRGGRDGFGGGGDIEHRGTEGLCAPEWYAT